jgi:hypothetical protein
MLILETILALIANAVSLSMSEAKWGGWRSREGCLTLQAVSLLSAGGILAAPTYLHGNKKALAILFRDHQRLQSFA